MMTKLWRTVKCKTSDEFVSYRFRGETKLEPDERIKIETKPLNGDVTSTLTIETLKLDDKGDIKAVGKNQAGETSATAKLNVIGTY